MSTVLKQFDSKCAVLETKTGANNPVVITTITQNSEGRLRITIEFPQNGVPLWFTRMLRQISSWITEKHWAGAVLGAMDAVRSNPEEKSS